MKLYEAMKALDRNPENVFEAPMNGDWKCRMTVDPEFGGYYKFEIFYGYELVDQSLGSGAFNGNVALNLDWQPIQKGPIPITVGSWW